MSLSRLMKFALFGHATAAVACYELGKHTPHGYIGNTSTATQVKDHAKRIGKYEAIALVATAFIQPEAAAFLVAYSIPIYAYYLGRYQTLTAEERPITPNPMRR